MKRTTNDTYLGLTDPRFSKYDAERKDLYFRNKLYERDNGICGICGEWVEYDDMDIDHIVPLSLGGPTTWDNLRVTHQHCNRGRGNRI